MNVVNWSQTHSNLVFNILEKEGIEMDHYYSPFFQVVVSGAPIFSVSKDFSFQFLPSPSLIATPPHVILEHRDASHFVFSDAFFGVSIDWAVLC